MPSSSPSAIPPLYETETLILHYHHLLDYLLDHAHERPFNLTRICIATAIPVRTVIFLFQTIHKTFHLFRLQHETVITDLDREYDRLNHDLNDSLPDELHDYCLSSLELVKLCDLIFLLEIKPFPFSNLPAEDQTLVDACPALFVFDAEHRVAGSRDAYQIIDEYRNCQKLNTNLQDYCGKHVRIRIKTENRLR